MIRFGWKLEILFAEKVIDESLKTNNKQVEKLIENINMKIHRNECIEPFEGSSFELLV